jgi:arylsulfatase
MSAMGDQDMSKINTRGLDRRKILLDGTTLASASAVSRSATQAAQAQFALAVRWPNILVIFGDDIGQTNICAYSFVVMGYRTPNIDRLARKGTPI